MATRSATLKIAIDGEQKYKAAVEEINRENKTLSAEMRKLSAEYKGNEKSVEALTKKQTILDRQLLESNAKVEETKKQLESWRKTLEKVKKEQGATSQDYKDAAAKVQEYEAALANAETQQIKIQRSIDETGKALENEGKITLTVGDAVDKLAQKFGINLSKGTTDALNGTIKFSAGAVKAVGATAAAVTALIKVFKQLHEVTLQAAADADEVMSESLVTGLSTQTIQQLKYAENLIDVSYGTITGTLTKLTRNMANAKDGNEELAASFSGLGVAITDAATGQLRPAEEVFYDIVDALGQIESGTERDALAMELLGKSAQDINPLIEQGSDALRELAAEAEATGYVLDESQVKTLGEVDDAYQRMTLQIEAAKKELAVQFAPASTQAMKTFAKAVQDGAKALADSHVVESFANLLASTTGILDAGLDLVDSLPSWINPIKNLTQELDVLSGIAAAVADALTLISGLQPWNWGEGKIKQALGFGYGSGDASNIQRWRMRQQGTLDQYDSFYGRNAAGTQNWRGGMTLVGENGPELVSLPKGSQVYSNQHSQMIASGGDVFNITVANVEELDEIVDWYKSRRLRGRMA